VGALIGLGYAALAIKPSYSARATILWEPPGDSGEPSDRSFLTQVDSIKLPVNLMEVRKRMKLKTTIDAIKDKVNLLFDSDSHLVQVETTDGNGKRAAALVNTTIDVFLEYQRRVGRARGEEHLQNIEADIEVAQAQLKNARDSFDAFRKQMGVSDFALETKLAIQKAADLKQQADVSVAAALTEEARQRKLAEEVSHQAPTTMGGSSMNNPDVAALATLRSQLAGARAHLAPDHPQIVQLESQVQALEQRVKSGSSQAVQGAQMVMPNQQYLSLQAGISTSKITKEAEMERQETYKRFSQEAEKRLQQLSEAEGQAQQLLSRISLLETRVTELEAQRVRVRDSVRNASADFRVVTPATAPEKPNPSERRSIAIKFPVGALALALCAIFGFELKGLRVHTAREAGFWANTPVIASSTWPREQNTLGVLVDELSDAVPSMRGTTLVVGARVNEVPLAREVAYWLSHLSGFAQRGVVGADEPIVTPDTAPAAQTPSNVHVAPGVDASSSVGGRFPLARRSETGSALAVAQAWDGPPTGPSLRRAARLADRVLVVMAAGTLSVTDVAQLRSRLGRNAGIGLLLVGLNPEFVKLPDRVGQVDAFWHTRAA
jgi:uncharacterized protein involved in exopolysaccharide biosynthesis